MQLGSLFHWAPKSRREAIRKEGLTLGSESVSGDGPLPCIHLGTSPRNAWRLSGDTDWGSEEEDWDLWEVKLAEQDEVRVRAEYGPFIWEVKVHNVIPPDRLWWVGERQPWMTLGGDN